MDATRIETASAKAWTGSACTYGTSGSARVSPRVTADIAPMPTAWRRRSAVRRRGGACGGLSCPCWKSPVCAPWRRSPAGRLAGNRRAAVWSAAGGFRQHAGVSVDGQGDDGVAELVLHDLEVGSRGQGEGGGAVPQSVQGDRRQPGGGDQLREKAGHPVRPERGPVTVVNAYPASAHRAPAAASSACCRIPCSRSAETATLSGR